MLPLNCLPPNRFFTAWWIFPVRVLLCCKLILQSCKTLCTQKILDPSQIPFNSPKWGTMSWRPWGLLAFPGNPDSQRNKSAFSWWVLSDAVNVMNTHHTCHPALLDGCTGGQPWTKGNKAKLPYSDHFWIPPGQSDSGKYELCAFP